MKEKLKKLLEIIEELVSYNCIQCTEKSRQICDACPVRKLKRKALEIIEDEKETEEKEYFE